MQLSFVLLAKKALPDAQAIADSYARLFPGEPALTAAAGASKNTVAELRSRGATTFIAEMPGPIPDGEADEAAARSLSAFTGFELGPHAAHFVVTTQFTSLEGTEALAAHTRVVAAVVEAHGAIGVYEGNAQATHDPQFYVDVATSTDLPLMLWNGISIARGKDSIELLTLGMAQLDLPDMLLVAPQQKGGEALEFVFDLLAYVVRRGKGIAEGETVGRNEHERLTVHYVASPIDNKAKVARVEMR